MAQEKNLSDIALGFGKLLCLPSYLFFKGNEYVQNAICSKLDKAIQVAEDMQHGKGAVIGYPVGKIIEGLSKGYKGGVTEQIVSIAVALSGTIIITPFALLIASTSMDMTVLQKIGFGYAMGHASFISVSLAIPVISGAVGGMLGMCSGIINFDVGLERAKQARQGVVTNPKHVAKIPSPVFSAPPPPSSQQKIDTAVTTAVVILNDPDLTDEDRKVFAEKLSEKFPGLFEPPAKQPDPIDMRAPHDMVVKPLVLRRSRQSSAV